MNDTTPAKATRKFLLPVVLGILAIGGIGYFASKAGLDKALVKESVDNFAADLRESSNDTMSFTYKDIRIEGGFSDRHAVLVEPTLEQSPEALESEEKIIYTTEAALLFPTASDLSALKIILPHPIKGYRGQDTSGEAMLIVIQKSAFEIDVSETSIDGKPFILSRVSVPDSLLVDGPESERDQPWNQFTMSIRPGAVITNSHSKSADAPEGLGRTDIEMKEIVLTPQHDAADAITIAEFTTHYNNVQKESGASSVDMTADIGPITGSENALPYGPIDFTMEMRYEGLLSSSPEDFASGSSNEKSLKVETFSLKTKDAALFATADFVSGAKDVLPVGTANITIENLPFILGELRRREILDSSKESMLDAAITRITGKNIAATTDLTIDIKRVRDGAFQIGNTTFEELMAIVLRSVFSGEPSAPVIAEPEPTPAPAQVPAEPAPAATNEVE